MNASLCAIVVAATCLASGAAAAQTVYRCGNEYAREPCAEGRRIDVADPVTAERRAQALEAARREQRLGEAMARERRAEAAAYRPTLAASLGPVAHATAKPVPAKKKTKARKKPFDPKLEDGDFVARVPKAKAAAAG